MSKNTIVFLDSGIGALPYYLYFKKRNPQNIIYVADRENFPYGPKSKEELVAILLNLVARILERCKPAIIVLACNTASISALPELRKTFSGVLFVGTVPAVKPAVLAGKTGVIGLLGTERTIEDPCITSLALKTGKACRITKIAAPELVEFIENSFIEADEAEKINIAKSYVSRFRNAGADAIVLGCTHFLFLLAEFKKAGGDDIAIFDSVEGVCRRTELLVHNTNKNGIILAEGRGEEILSDFCTAKNAARAEIPDLLLLTGSSAIEEKWGKFADMFHLKTQKFEDFS
ncbi:MAG: glutamate racemase [Spirochaetaceae bacterium]|jgi:glutamate racemase|nr:glutamate racemase [Spirochaetaceae bacterium]